MRWWILACARFEVFTVEKIQVEVFWVVTPCSVVVGYQRFRVPCCLHLNPENLSRGLLSCDAVQCCGTIPAIRRTLLTPSSGWPLKLWYHTTTLYGVITQKTSTWSITTVEASEHSSYLIVLNSVHSCIPFDWSWKLHFRGLNLKFPFRILDLSFPIPDVKTDNFVDHLVFKAWKPGEYS
jgi:hypothetical protein